MPSAQSQFQRDNARPQEDGIVVLRGVTWGDYQSKVLPGIDLAELAAHIDRPTTSAAVREYTAKLRKKGRATRRRT